MWEVFYVYTSWGNDSKWKLTTNHLIFFLGSKHLDSLPPWVLHFLITSCMIWLFNCPHPRETHVHCWHLVLRTFFSMWRFHTRRTGRVGNVGIYYTHTCWPKETSTVSKSTKFRPLCRLVIKYILPYKLARKDPSWWGYHALLGNSRRTNSTHRTLSTWNIHLIPAAMQKECWTNFMQVIKGSRDVNNVLYRISICWLGISSQIKEMISKCLHWENPAKVTSDGFNTSRLPLAIGLFTPRCSSCCID